MEQFQGIKAALDDKDPTEQRHLESLAYAVYAWNFSQPPGDCLLI